MDTVPNPVPRCDTDSQTHFSLPHGTVQPTDSSAATDAPPPPRADELVLPPPTNIAARFRTVSCATFSAKHKCPYNDRCMFAHGPNQLRSVHQNVDDGLVTEAAIKAFLQQQGSAQRRRERGAAIRPNTQRKPNGQRKVSTDATNGAPRVLQRREIDACHAHELSGDNADRRDASHMRQHVPDTAPTDGGEGSLPPLQPELSKSFCVPPDSFARADTPTSAGIADRSSAATVDVVSQNRQELGHRREAQLAASPANAPASATQPVASMWVAVTPTSVTPARYSAHAVSPSPHGADRARISETNPSLPLPEPMLIDAGLARSVIVPRSRFPSTPLIERVSTKGEENTGLNAGNGNHNTRSLVATPSQRQTPHSQHFGRAMTACLHTLDATADEPTASGSRLPFASSDIHHCVSELVGPAEAGRRGSEASIASFEADSRCRGGTSPSRTPAGNTPSTTSAVRLRRHNPYSPDGSRSPRLQTLNDCCGVAPSFAASPHSGGPRTPHDAVLRSGYYDEHATSSQPPRHGLPRSMSDSFSPSRSFSWSSPTGCRNNYRAGDLNCPSSQVDGMYSATWTGTQRSYDAPPSRENTTAAKAESVASSPLSLTSDQDTARPHIKTSPVLPPVIATTPPPPAGVAARYASQPPTLAPAGPNERDGAPATGIAARFRTRLCEKFEATRRCPYAYRCMFAHGRGQLRTATVNVADGLTSEAAVKAFQWNQRESVQRRKAQYAANHPGTVDTTIAREPVVTPRYDGAPPSLLNLDLVEGVEIEDFRPLPAAIRPIAYLNSTPSRPYSGTSASLLDSLVCVDDDHIHSFVSMNDASPNAAQHHLPSQDMHGSSLSYPHARITCIDVHMRPPHVAASYPHPRFTGTDIHHYRPELVGTPPVADLGHSLTTYMRTPNFNASVASIRSIDRSHGLSVADRRGSLASIASAEGDDDGTPVAIAAAIRHTPSTLFRVRQHNPYALAPLTIPPAMHGSPPHRQTPGHACRTSIHSGGSRTLHTSSRSSCHDEHIAPPPRPAQSPSVTASFRGHSLPAPLARTSPWAGAWIEEFSLTPH
jgi:hypothetical protein